MTTTTTETHKATGLTVALPKFIANEKSLPTRKFKIVEVNRETQKAFLAVISPLSDRVDNCHRCGLAITNPVSIQVGYGPDCCEHLGLTRPSQANAEEWLENAVKWISAMRYEIWVPKRYVKDYESVSSDSPSQPQVTAASVIEDRLIIKSTYEMRDRCRMVRGAKWDKESKSWVAPATPSAVEDFLTAFEGNPYTVDPQVRELASQVALPDAPPSYSPVDHGLNIDLWRHQLAAVNYAKDKEGVMIPLKVGRGKTAAAMSLIGLWKARRVLVIAPKFVSKQWPEMAREYGLWSEHENARFLSLGSGGSVAERAAVLHSAILSGDPFMACVNYESVWRTPMSKIIASTEWDVVVADEAHRIRNADSKQSKFVGGLNVNAKRRVALTGTPMAQSVLDVFGQYRFLDPTVFGTSWPRFKNQYGVVEVFSTPNGSFEKIVGVKNGSDLKRRYDSIAFKPAPGDDVELPDVHHITRTFSLSSKAAKIYNNLLDEMFACIENGTLTPANGAVRIIRLQQITGGYAKLDDEGAIDPENGGLVKVDSGKAELLEETLEEIGKEPVVVFCRFRKDIDTVIEVANRLGYGGGELSGRGDQREGWHKGDFNVLAVQIQAGAEGINDLVRSRYAIYYSIGHSLKDYTQSVGRLERPGQKSDVTIFHLLADEQGVDFSVDRSIYSAIQEKQDIIDSVVKAARSRKG